jgi:hypothetical protein
MNATQVTTYDNTKITSIFLGYMQREEGNKLAKKLNGKTFMDFKVLIVPAGGQCAITAQTFFDDDKDEILGMFLGLMASELARS